MRLKRLELQGFKSFARPVSLEFGSGITAIVGPNGSGKSNIADAIRWVLGEQSIRSLRGQKMEDVIFAGSDGKRPLGLAQVELTLDNSAGFLPLEYAEVAVARRVYRSGESEFFINQQNCRLKDIQDLFTDTGLGREGCALIGQGQVETVLSARSEDRRILLEETAGIVKYRQRKERALTKLEETNLDLLRVTDILQELQGQLEPLRQQAEKAECYLNLAQELQTAELDYFHLRWRELALKRESTAESYQQTLEAQQKESAVCLEWEASLTNLEALLSSLERQLADKQEEQLSLADACSKGKHTIELNQERLKNNATRRKQLAAVLAEKEEELKGLEKEEARLQTRQKSMARQIASQERTVLEEQEQATRLAKKREETQSSLEGLKNEFFDFMRELTESRNYYRGFQERQQTLQTQMLAFQEESKQAAQGVEELKNQVQTLAEKASAAEKSIAQSRLHLAALAQEIGRTQKTLEEKQKESRRLQARFAQLQSRRKTLKELERGYEGYGQGVRQIMQNPQLRCLVLGTVAQVIEVPQGLETAFEVALASALQNVITETEEEAKQLLAWLKAKGAGRVTFLPLAAMVEKEFPPSDGPHLNKPGVLGTGVQLLSFEKKYAPALKSLLGRVVVTEDLEVALNLRKQLSQFSKIVTRDGSLVFPSGALTGGSLNTRTVGLLSRKAEIGKLEDDLRTLKRTLAEKAQEARCLSEKLQREETSAAQLQKTLLDEQLRKEGWEQRKIQLKEEQARLQRGLQQKESKIQELQTVFNSLGAQEELAAASVLELESQETLYRQTVAEQELGLAALSGELQKSGERLAGQRVKLAELKGRWENLGTQRENTERRTAENREICGQARLEQEKLVAAGVCYEQIVAQTAQANRKREAQRADLEQEVEKLRQKRAQAQAELKEIRESLQQAQKQQAQTERVLYKWELELAQLEKEREQILESLKEREIQWQDVVNRQVTQEKKVLRNRRDRLRRQIRALGLVNPQAAEEYARIKKRCSFLETQLNDLNKARQSLQTVINEMDRLCRLRLRETFQAVKAEFQSIFAKLFLGGRADLILTDPESVLTTGIDVLAQPPGKKLQNLLLLSGGERALTAIALLFAIRKVKPAPFCVLDEIDATLDNSNLVRFSHLLREFAEDTQFVIITHRPGTMEVAHTLYGVTMGRDAVSQIVSVALT